MRLRGWPIAGWTLTAVATCAAAFVLPYRFPLHEPVLSDTYTAGANNQIAAIALAILSLAVTIACWFRTPDATHTKAPQPLIRRFLYAGIAAAIAWTAALGSAVARAHMYWGDEGYFLNQLRSGLLFHQAIYRQFEFAYGPALFWWPALCIRALAPLGLSMTAAYLVSLALMQAAGLVLLFYVVEALPMRRTLKAAAFVLITFGTLTSLLGLNYSIFRFVLPMAAVVLLSRQRSLAAAAAVAALGEMAMLAVSPELGVAFAGAALVYGAWRSIADGPRWGAVGIASLIGAATFAASIGPDYFYTLGNMARGGFNLLLTPAPHIVALLFAVVVLAPLAVARVLRQHQPNAAMLTALYVAALGLLPAALGRSDPIHAFFDGIGLYLLAFVALDAASPRWQRLWIAAVACVFLFTQAKNFRLYQYRLGLVLRTHAVQEDFGFDLPKLRATIGNDRISAPILAPQPVLDDLTRTGQYVPGYFCAWVGVWDSEAERRKIADMRQTRFALVAFSDPVFPDPAEDRRLHRLMQLGLAHHPPRAPWQRGALLDAELKQNWKPRGVFGDYALFERQR